MAAPRGGSSIGDIFEKPLPENPTLMESLSTPWKPKQPADHSSITEIFGELHFKEPSYPLSPRPSSFLSGSSSSSPDVINLQPETEKLNDNNNENKMNPSSDSLLGMQKNQYMKSSKSATGFSSNKAESLKLCTEGLGFESSGDVDNSKDEGGDDLENNQKEKMSITRSSSSSANLNEYRRLRILQGDFPPPITCLGKNGKPWVCWKSFKYNGRFILKEIQVPTKEFMHATREDGRLTLHFAPQDEEIPEEEEEGLEEEETEYEDAIELEDEEYDYAYEQEDEEEEEEEEEEKKV